MVEIYCGIALLTLLVFGYAACKCCWEPQKEARVRRCSIGISACFVLLSTACAAASGYAYTNAEVFEKFFSRDAVLYYGLVGSGGVLVYALIGCVAAWRRSKLCLLVFMLLLAVVLLAELVAGLVMAWWVRTSYVEQADAYVVLSEQAGVAEGESVIKYKSPLNVPKDTYDYSCCLVRSYEYHHLMTDSPRATLQGVRCTFVLVF